MGEKNKITVLSSLKEEIERGKTGLNEGLPMGFDRLTNAICNIQKARYDCIGGHTGSGKTSLVDSAYIFEPFNYLQTNPESPYKLEVIYYSVEIDPVVKLAKMVANKVWEQHGILTHVNEIFGRGKYRLPQETYDAILNSYDYFEKLKDVVFFRNSLNPNFLWKDILGYAESRGTVTKNKDGIIVNYKPDNPFLITLIIIDHFSLIDKNQQDGSKKEAMDRASKMLVQFRNIFKFSPVAVCQFNRGIEGMDRREQNAMEPQLSDFKDTGAIQEDANTVLALFYPYRYKIESHRGYPIKPKIYDINGESMKLGFKKNYRSLHLLKNRDGEDTLNIGMHFLGQVGKFTELPLSKEIEKNPMLIDHYMDLEKFKKLLKF